MNKLLFATAIFCLVQSANAQSKFEGFYGQVGLGYESTNPKISNGTHIPSGNAFTVVNSNNQSGLIGNISIGSYFGISNSFLLGIGVEYSPLTTSNAKWTADFHNNNVTDEPNEFKKKKSFNVFISPALIIDQNKLVFTKVGYTRMYSQTTDNNGDIDSYIFNGYLLGIGFKQIIKGGLYGFAEGNYTSYRGKTLIETTSNSKPNTINFLIGLGYKF
ncbi:MAG: porin family protein [Betaproteobacteria bacterium]|nr:porin family protein [Betaproteobacteria bacterium]